MDINSIDMNGLTQKEALKLQSVYGKNELEKVKKISFFMRIIRTITEPMFLLLLCASIIYFFLGQAKDGIVMLVFIIGMITIEFIQEFKTDKTLEALKKLSSPQIMVVRNGHKKEIDSRDLVPGDIMIIHEGIKIPADGFVVSCSGLVVDEATLTGEAEGVRKKIFNEDNKEDYFRSDYCYAGTLVTSGTGLIYVDKIGASTEYGNIGKTINNVKETKTPLEIQTNKLVKACTILAFILFFMVILVTYINLSSSPLKDRIIKSILSGVTLAMAMIPEEFPVILTVFLSMGASRLAKKHALIKKLSSVETLGAVSVLCVDKTGTITKNEMEVKEVYTDDNKELEKLLIMSSHENTFDPMEKAMIKYATINDKKQEHGTFVKDYPFSDDTKMMARAWHYNDEYILAVKGSPEGVLNACNNISKEAILKRAKTFSENGLRVIAVAKKEYEKEEKLPTNTLNDLEFVGLVGLIDPPRDSVFNDIKMCHDAGIKLVMITGDNGITACSIAKKIGMDNCDEFLTGDEIDKMSDEELKNAVRYVNIFSRVVPKHKMRIVKAFKDSGEIVAMTGDGVNDAPALKYADIGIAMGKRGSEVSREAANMILLDDNFSTIVDTIKDGRKIYDNIKKAVAYVLTIHVPIAFASLLAPLFGLDASVLMFLPIHVVIMELIIDPTSSIVFERIPAENKIMEKRPRKRNEKIIDFKDFLASMLKGLTISLASFLAYYYVLTKTKEGILTARTMGLLIIVLSNIFLVLINSSSNSFVFKNIKKLLKDRLLTFIFIFMILMILVAIYSPLNQFLRLQSLNFNELLVSLLLAFLSTFWYEFVKLFKNVHN